MKHTIALLLVAVMVLAVAACGPAGPEGEQELAEELHVYNWSEYIDPEIYADFEAEFGVKVIEDTFASN
ncbi:MAG TPA: spermidine/putrescine ABC transporter substrate-binding protein, partial [Anaerolineae bacterium]|nr:spermidine/putrescine ABC transporter substrate-binding protein [Anaerolineae bacterium]